MENRSAIMKISLGKISLVLWLITIAAIGFFMVRGTTADKAADARTPIFLSLQEKELVLEEMRTMLQSTQRIIEGTANNDMKQVAAAGRAAGMGSAIDLDPVFLAKLPLDFKTLGFSMHADMDAIGKAAEGGADAQEINKMLSNTLLKCVGCHSTWQISTKADAGSR